MILTEIFTGQINLDVNFSHTRLIYIGNSDTWGFTLS